VCECSAGRPRTQDYCDWCNPGTHIDPRTRKCVGVKAAHQCRNPLTRKIIKYRGSRKPILCFRPPRVVTEPPRHVRRHSAVLRGRIDPHRLGTHWYFFWGACPHLNHRTPIHTTHHKTHVSVTVHHLRSGTRYCYRVVGVSRRGMAIGGLQHFRTLIAKPPTIKKPHGFTG
jgi:hypothetical protein